MQGLLASIDKGVFLEGFEMKRMVMVSSEIEV
jgi:hypothetical protein